MESPTFDIIIVGGRTAGCVIASRLSTALSQLSILLIEAGPESHPCVEHPLGHSAGTGIEWDLETVPQAVAGEKPISAMCGKVLGGSSAINYQAWTRGPAIDFNQWAALVEDKRWSWDGFLPYFKKSETFYAGELPVDMDLHGSSGPVKISHPSSAGIKRKYPLRDFIASHVLGYGELGSSTYLGKRQWSANCYGFGPNVTVWTEVQVEKVIFDGYQAKSVKVAGHAEGYVSAIANKEVILCSGAYGSAKLLLLSGVGPTEELERHNIPQISDLPVGQNLSDHPCVQTFWKFKDRGLCLGDSEIITPSCDWGAGSPCDWFAFHRNETKLLALAHKHLDTDAAGMYTAPGKAHFESFAMYGHFAIGKSAVIPPPNCSTMAIFNILVYPTSRGSVTLSSNNAIDPPIIDPKLLTTELDKETMYACLRLTNRALHGEIGRSYGVEEFGVLDEDLCDNSPEALLRRTEKTIFTLFHPSGTCAMGTVVDSECKVLNIGGVRVVDVSIFPFPLAAHYQAAVYAVAEQAADMIIESFKLNHEP